MKKAPIGARPLGRSRSGTFSVGQVEVNAYSACQSRHHGRSNSGPVKTQLHVLMTKELIDAIRERSDQRGLSMSRYVVELIKRDLGIEDQALSLESLDRRIQDLERLVRPKS